MYNYKTLTSQRYDALAGAGDPLPSRTAFCRMRCRVIVVPGGGFPLPLRTPTPSGCTEAALVVTRIASVLKQRWQSATWRAGGTVQGDEVVEGLTALFRRLRTEVERAQATPAMRLLDDLLYVMDSDWGSSEAARLEATQERMDAAFDPNSGAPPAPHPMHCRRLNRRCRPLPRVCLWNLSC